MTTFSPHRLILPDSTIQYLMALLFLFLHFINIFTAQCVHIADGDTITVLDKDHTQIRVRLYGIDCPEHGQDYGNVAKQFTSDFCKGKTVRICKTGNDRYGRTLAFVIVGKDTLNTELLKAGLAWHYSYYDGNPVWQRYEAEARKAKKGLWSLPNSIQPYEWRKAHQHKRAIN